MDEIKNTVQSVLGDSFQIKIDDKIFISADLKQVSSYDKPKIEFTICVSQNNNNKILIKPSSSLYMTKHVLSVVFDAICIKPQYYDQEIYFDYKPFYVKLFFESLNHLVKTDNFYRYCPLCLKIKTISSSEISSCKDCEPESFDKVYDNTVTDAYKKGINIFKFLLLTTLNAIDTKDRFVPIPAYCLTNTYESSFFDKSVVSRDMEYYMNIVSKATNDTDLIDRLSAQEFMLLKHMIISNNTSLHYYDNNDSDYFDKNSDIWNSKKSLILFTVSHSPEKQKLFDSADVVHMFHGSQSSNWYSILRNGLKNFSGTKMMSNGQAYGAGIYLATEINTSLGYCKTVDNYSIIGVVQVLNSESYKKTPGIYVVPNESDVLLKYLVVFKNSGKLNNDLVSIEKYLTKTLPTTINKNITDSLAIVIKRLNKEYQDILKVIKKLKKLDIIVEESFDSKDKMYFNIESVNIEVVFPRYFPTMPCTIVCKTDRNLSIPALIKSNTVLNTYVYEDPILRFDMWRSDVRVSRVLEQLFLNIHEAK